MEREQSVISKSESTSLKGFLILLIVLCHNSLLNCDINTGEILPYRAFIYLFHVSCFFILPYLYGYNYRYGRDHSLQNLWRDVKSGAVRCLVPYSWLFAAFVVFAVLSHRSVDAGMLISAYFDGSQPALVSTLGVHFLWFLPAMFACLTVKSLWYNTVPWGRILLFLLGILLFIQDVSLICKTFNVWRMLPFSLMLGFKYLLMGLMVRWMLIHVNAKYYIPVCITLFCLFAVWFFLHYGEPQNQRIAQERFLEWVMPICTFPILYACRDVFCRSRLLFILGKYSLYIYIIHIFAYNIVNTILIDMFGKNYWLGILSFLMVISISLLLSMLIDKLNFLKKVVFPKLQ